MENLHTFLFYVTAALTGLCAVGVVVTQNIVRAAGWLLFALAGTAGVFFFLGAEFVGATQLLVYVGGTLVLVVFGVMLTAQGPFITMKTSPVEWAVSVVVGTLFLGVLALTLAGEKRWEAYRGPAEPEALASDSFRIGAALIGSEQHTPPGNVTGVPVGKDLPRRKIAYLLPFEIVSVHLLVVLVGAAYLARAKRRRGAVP